MKRKALTLALAIALLASLGALAWALWQIHWWRWTADLLADEAGSSWAARSFRKGQFTIWELDPTNDTVRFSGRKDGPFEIWLSDYHAEMPSPWQHAERKKLEAHNKQMRYMYDHPERFKREPAVTNTTPADAAK
jgi:phage repressor protein C with HTH and peptisase S24 domain